MEINLAIEPIGTSDSGQDVFLFKSQYDSVVDGPKEWRDLQTSSGVNFKWDPESTYIQKPPYFEDFQSNPETRSDIANARVLVYMEDSVTTDHISPAGSIPPSAPAGQILSGNDVPRREYNSFGSRRGNHDVMVRGTFGNIRLRNKLASDMEGDWTTHFPTEQLMRIYEASEQYREENVPLIIIAGKEYGTGSSRDWAAKGPMLLGVRTVIAQSFERIHRSNLIGMGVLPLVFKDGESAESLGLDGTESFNIPGVATSVEPSSTVSVTAISKDGKVTKFETLARIDTAIENEYYRHGGLLPYVLRQMIQ